MFNRLYKSAESPSYSLMMEILFKNLKTLNMKTLLFSLAILLSFSTVYASINPKPGFNYKKHHRKCKKVKVLNKIFNFNNCRNYKYHN